jgi:hypothetical protein
MERSTSQPLTLEEAKARLRLAVATGDASAWVWRSPRYALLAAFLLGFTVGTSAVARDALASAVVALLRRSRL